MKKKIFGCLIVCIVVVLSYFYANIDKNTYIYDKQADTATYMGTGVLIEGEELRQTFVASENTIDALYMKVSTIGDAGNVVLHYAILDHSSNEITNAFITAEKLENNKFNKLDIPQISGTKGKEFTLILREENSDEQNGVSFYLEPAVHGEQQLVVKDNETAATLITRVVCHRFDAENFVVLLGMVAFITIFMKALYKLFK